MPKKQRTDTRMTPGFTGPFKGAPQQGTLFGKRALDQLPGNVVATQARPGPRGYSPARLAEVRGAFDTAHVSGGGRTEKVRPVEVGGFGRVNETAHQFGPSSWDPDNPHFGRARSRILDTLSRSTIDVGDEMTNPLAGLGQIKFEKSHPEAAGMYKAQGNYAERPDAGGNFRPMGPTITLYGHENAGTDAADKGRDEPAEQTLLHELGHHESNISGSESSRYGTPRERAQEEARADTFAVTHFRRDPRNKGAYDPRQNTYLARGAHVRFDRAAEGHDWDSGRTVMHPGAPGVYAQTLPASMHPPVKNPNIGKQFEQDELEPAKGRHAVGDIFYGPGVEKPRERTNW